jgi:hypothetical protein
LGADRAFQRVTTGTIPDSIQIRSTKTDINHVISDSGLKCADSAQQPFSLDNCSTIAYAVSTLEWLLQEWKGLLENTKYSYFHDALTNGLEKIEKYYQLITEKQAYSVCMGMSSTIFTHDSHFELIPFL